MIVDDVVRPRRRLTAQEFLPARLIDQLAPDQTLVDPHGHHQQVAPDRAARVREPLAGQVWVRRLGCALENSRRLFGRGRPFLLPSFERLGARRRHLGS